MTAPLTGIFAIALGADALGAGLAVASSGLLRLPVDLFGAQWMSRIDGRLALWLSMAMFGAGSLASAIAPTLELMVAARMFQGLGGALFQSGGLQLAVRLAAPGGRGTAIGNFNAFWFVGVGSGPFLGGGAAALTPGVGGLRFAFAVCGVVNLVGALSARVALPALPSGRRPALGLPGLSGLARPRGLATLIVGGLGQSVRLAVAMTLLPLLGLRLGLSTVVVGVALSMLALADIAAMRLGSRMADRRGRRVVLVPALALGATACLLGAHVRSVGAFVVLCAVVGIPVGIAWVVPAAMAIDLAGDTEHGLGAYRLAASLGAVLGSVLIGAAIRSLGESGALAAAAGGMVTTAMLTVAIGETLAPAGTPLLKPACEPATRRIPLVPALDAPTPNDRSNCP